MKFLQRFLFVTLFATGIFFIAQPASAATVNYYVRTDGSNSNNGLTDSSDGAWLTLQHAITNVSNPTTDTIIINVGAGTYSSENNSIDIDRNFTNLQIIGAGATQTIFVPHLTPASATDRNFNIGSTENVTLSDMTIRDGYLGSGNGAAVLTSSGGSLTMQNCIVEDNDGSGNFNAAGIWAQNTLTINNCTVFNNNGGYTGGVGVDGSNTVNKITNSTFYDNTGVYGGNVAVGYQATLILTNNTISGGNEGVGKFNSSFTYVYMQNNIVYGLDGGLALDFDGATSKVGGKNNIIYDSQDGAYFANGVNGNLVGTSLAVNLSTTLAQNNTLNETPTLEITAGSVAINAGLADAHGPTGNQVTPTAEDQRGLTRVSTIDIGAYEYGGYSDTTDPTLDSVSPTDGATSVGVSSNLVMTFSEAVDAETGSITLYKNGSTVVETFDVTSDISGSGTDTITINPSQDLESSTAYSVQVDATAFDDLAGNSYAGIANHTTWNFTSADVAAPTVTNLAPADGGIGIAPSVNFVLTFNEAVSVQTGNISIYRASDDALIEAVDVAGALVTGTGTDTITVNPAADLGSTTEYYVQVDATAFDDLAGNSYAGIADTTTWNVTTADVNTPAVVTVTPADGATDVAVATDLVMTFTEAVDVETGNITIKKSSDNSVVETVNVQSAAVTGSGTTVITIALAADLAIGSAYYVQVDATAFDDVAGNSYAGIADTTSWNFTTVAPPEETSSGGSSSDGDTNTDTDDSESGADSGDDEEEQDAVTNDKDEIVVNVLRENRNAAGGAVIRFSVAADTTTEEVDDESEESTKTAEENSVTNEAPAKIRVLTIEVKENDQPVANADVELHSDPMYGTTNSEGVVTFTNVEPGEHTLYVKRDGMVAEQKVQIEEGTEVLEMVVNVTLVQKASLAPYWITLVVLLIAAFGYVGIRQQKQQVA